MSKRKKQIRYSPTEVKVLETIGRGWVTTDELIPAVYGADQPFHARNMLNTAVRSLMKKMDLNGDPIVIEREKVNGSRLMRMRRARR